jgi:hypothetical protein
MLTVAYRRPRASTSGDSLDFPAKAAMRPSPQGSRTAYDATRKTVAVRFAATRIDCIFYNMHSLIYFIHILRVTQKYYIRILHNISEIIVFMAVNSER